MSVSDYNTDPNSNTSISGINIAEGCPPSGINNAIRQMMADIRAADDANVKLTGNLTVGGVKTFTDWMKTKGFYQSASNGSAIVAGGAGVGANDGAKLTLYGKDEATDPGEFKLLAGDITAYKVLSGAPDGTLTWDSKDIITDGGNQTIGGTKTFTSDPIVFASSPNMVFKSSSLVQSSDPSVSGYAYPAKFLDKNGDFLGYIEFLVGDDGSRRARIASYKQDGTTAILQCGFYANGTAYATAPTPASYDDNGTSIATTNWVNNASKIVHTSGNQTIGGVKTFSDWMIAKGFYQSISNGSVIVGGGNGIGASAGAKITLYGASESTNPGQFSVLAGNSSMYKTLNGNPNGTFTWNGQNIQVGSDERIKTAIGDFPDDVLDAWGAVCWEQFKYREDVERKGEENCRFHAGLVTQHVQQAMQAQGVDPLQYGILCHEEWQDETDEEGNVIREAGDLWMVRYTEALAMEAAYQRRRADRAEARITTLERRLDEMEAVLATLGA